MHPNAALLTRFYEAFQRADADAMVACYAPDVEFSDVIFTHLTGEQASDMWRMLCRLVGDLQVSFRDIQADDTHGSAHWEAHYKYSTGKRVHNIVDASFEFRDGLIVKHHDAFDLWRWSSMAIGMKGRFLGWLPFVHKAIRQQAAERLKAFRSAAGPL
jgi:ketosteroid isomerase-like protein